MRHQVYVYVVYGEDDATTFGIFGIFIHVDNAHDYADQLDKLAGKECHFVDTVPLMG